MSKQIIVELADARVVFPKDTIIIPGVRVDRTRTPMEAINATGRKRCSPWNDDDVATMSQGEGDVVDVYLIPTRRYISWNRIAFLAQYGLVQDPYALIAANEADQTLADKYPNCIQLNNHCSMLFGSNFDERYIRYYRGGDGWSCHFSLSGVPTPRK